MKHEISIRNYLPEDVQDLANIYFNTVHRINIKDYTQEQVDVWAPKSRLEAEEWAKKFSKTNPIIALVGEKIVGFAELELTGYIDCFYCHHEWIGKGVGAALMKEVLRKAKSHNIDHIFSDVSITAKPFFEKQGFIVLAEQTVIVKGVQFINFRMEKKR